MPNKTLTDQQLLTMLEKMRQEAWDCAVWLRSRIMLYELRTSAKTLEAAHDLARLMRSIQGTEFVARKQGLDVPWPQREHIAKTLDSLGATDYRYTESFDQLTGPADEIFARALGIRL
jgi:hypothetical protein